jgi:hypothetical protein
MLRPVVRTFVFPLSVVSMSGSRSVTVALYACVWIPDVLRMPVKFSPEPFPLRIWSSSSSARSSRSSWSIRPRSWEASARERFGRSR